MESLLSAAARHRIVMNASMHKHDERSYKHVAYCVGEDIPRVTKAMS